MTGISLPRPTVGIAAGKPARSLRGRLGPAGLILAGLAASAVPALAGPVDFKSRSVAWTAAPATVPVAKRGHRVTLVLSGTPAEGWHIYGFRQQPRGPISLNVTLAQTPLATADGAPSASPPVKVFEPAFGVETPYYQRRFTVSVPVRLKPDVPAGVQSIPVNVRYQACAGGTCEPPKTIQLSAPVRVVN